MRKTTTLLLLVLTSFIFSTSVFSQERSVFWEHWNVSINNVDTANNTFDVREQYRVQFSGTFQFGSRVIPLERLSAIEDVRISQGGRALQLGRCVSSPEQGRGTYCVEQVQEGISIVYNFISPVTDASVDLEIAYKVVGALRSYEGGDQLWWIAVPQDKFGFSVGSSTIRVEMPSGYGPREGIDPVETYGVAGNVTVSGNTIVATAEQLIGPNDTFEIRVQYPHNPDGRTPSWQADFDRRRDFEENIKPLADLLLIVLSILVAVGGPLFVYVHWRNRGRDPEVGPVPTYLEEPPSDIRPAVVGTLLDETADTRDVLSTLIDLAQRGYLVIEETKTKGLFGIGGSSKHTFKRTDKPFNDLRSYERNIIQKVFKGKLEQPLESLNNKFYQHMASLQDDLYSELVGNELFKAKPNTTRGIYSGIAIAVLGAAVLLGFIAFNAIVDFTQTILCIPFALGFTGLALFVAGQHMPAKTEQGALEAAKWRAFKEYLENLERYADLDSVADQFDRYLPYAVAFGLDRSWIRRFSKVKNVPMPTWYFPTYRGGHYSRGYTAGTPVMQNLPKMQSAADMLPGELARADAGGLSLDSMAGSIGESLNSMSDSLTNMLNSASRTLTSRPSNSGGSGRWSGGGSSWSGGGGGGGGGSGGGSSGFG